MIPNLLFMGHWVTFSGKPTEILCVKPGIVQKKNFILFSNYYWHQMQLNASGIFKCQCTLFILHSQNTWVRLISSCFSISCKSMLSLMYLKWPLGSSNTFLLSFCFGLSSFPSLPKLTCCLLLIFWAADVGGEKKPPCDSRGLTALVHTAKLLLTLTEEGSVQSLSLLFVVWCGLVCCGFLLVVVVWGFFLAKMQ